MPFDVILGMSSAIAGPAAAGIPVTMRILAHSFTVVTGHEDSRAGAAVDWEALAATGSTLVTLMGVGRIGIIAGRLMDGWLSRTTPVAAVRWATTVDQSVHRTTLGDVADEPLAAPSVIVVGAVADLDLRSHLATSFA